MSQSIGKPILQRSAFGVAALALALLIACGTPAPAATMPAPTATVQAASPTATPMVSPTATVTARATGTPAAATVTRTAGSATPSPAVVGTRIDVRYGETGTVAAVGMSLRFVEVKDESRCPNSPTISCAHAGWATIAIEATRGREAGTLELMIPGLTHDTSQRPGIKGNSATFAGYTIQLVSLEPQPTGSGKAPSRDYVATLLVTMP